MTHGGRRTTTQCLFFCPNFVGRYSFYRPRGAGLVAGDSVPQVVPRCKLDAACIKEYLP